MTEPEYVPGQPPKIPTAVKAWLGFVITLVGANAAVFTAAWADGVISTQEWWGIGLAVVTSIGTGLGVYAAPRFKSTP
jgi:hypothetical protein